MKKILYISTTFPSLTLTFVYREIEALLSAGYEIQTVSLGKPPEGNVSEEALNFYRSTLYLDQVNLLQKLLSVCRLFKSHPVKYLELARTAIREKEIRGLKDKIRILYHLIEAGYLYTQLRESGFDHIHAHFLSGPTSVALFLSHFLNIPFSFTIHASSIFTDHIMLETKLIECKKAVTISEYNKKYLLKTYGKHFSDKIEVIHCGIDMKSFVPEDSTKPWPPIILAVGQLVKRKGFDYLVQACKELKAKNSKFQCWIVGDGPERQHLENIVKQYDLDHEVLLLGRKPQEVVKTYLNQASIFALPSRITAEGGREGIPVALMEAMAMQIPVVSTYTVGIPELIEHEKEGFLIEPENTLQLASALEFFLNDSETRLKMGQHGRQKILKHFNIEHVPQLLNPVFNKQ